MVKTAKPYRGGGMEGFVANWYARTTAKSMGEYASEARRVADLLVPGAKVLEVAPGPGYFAIELAKRASFEVTGLDISHTFVDLAKQNGARAGVRVDFRHGSASDMPFDDGQFDFVYCRAAFKNFSEPVRALREMYRVLKPAGRALIVDLRRDAPMSAISEGVAQMHLGFFSALSTRLTFRFMLLKRAYTKETFEELISETQFPGVRIVESGIGLEVWLQK